MENQGEIVLYQLDKEVKLEVRLENETVWLSIDEMSQLFGRDISVIVSTFLVWNFRHCLHIVG